MVDYELVKLKHGLRMKIQYVQINTKSVTKLYTSVDGKSSLILCLVRCIDE